MEQINILVVDDEKEIADLVEIYLVSDGYKVFKANNAKEGKKAYLLFFPNLDDPS